MWGVGVKLSIIIPVYNEETRLAKNTHKVLAYLDERVQNYELVIVNDGSTDTTDTVIDILESESSHVRSIQYAKNKGKGYAVRKGVMESNGESIFFIDADGSTPIESLEDLLPYLEQGTADVVIGSRNLKESNREAPQPLWRQVLGKIGNVMIRKILSLKVKDTQCGFKGFTKEAAKALFSKATINRWGFDFEILVIANTLRLKIVEVPVRWMDSEGSRFNLIGGSVTTLLELARVKFNSVMGKYN